MELINDFVNVTSFSFYHSKLQNQPLKTFPKEIELGSKHYTFKDGFQYLVQSGEKMIRLFDMTDGQTTYRLRQDNDQWLLIGTRPA